MIRAYGYLFKASWKQMKLGPHEALASLIFNIIISSGMKVQDIILIKDRERWRQDCNVLSAATITVFHKASEIVNQVSFLRSHVFYFVNVKVSLFQILQQFDSTKVISPFNLSLLLSISQLHQFEEQVCCLLYIQIIHYSLFIFYSGVLKKRNICIFVDWDWSYTISH